VKSTQELEQDGFTASGLARYQGTVEAYADTLHIKAITYGDADKAPDLPREVTHDHVRAAAHLIANSYGKDKASSWWVVSQVAEYILTATSAFALGNIDKNWGTPVFVISAVIAGILIAVRLSKSKSK
jgi:hypothetical protein|tara:strand:- start:2277 stop:2660 length:384 start_codon:yes stop_codon:yes gene_type:complete